MTTIFDSPKDIADNPGDFKSYFVNLNANSSAFLSLPAAVPEKKKTSLVVSFGSAPGLDEYWFYLLIH